MINPESWKPLGRPCRRLPVFHECDRDMRYLKRMCNKGQFSVFAVKQNSIPAMPGWNFTVTSLKKLWVNSLRIRAVVEDTLCRD